MRETFALLLLVVAVPFLSQCGDGPTTGDYLTVSGVPTRLSPGSATAFPSFEYIEFTPSDRFPARHIRVEGGDRPEEDMLLAVTVDADTADSMLLVFAPDEDPGDVQVFAPTGFHFPEAWRYDAAGAPGAFQVVLPARSGTLSVQRFRQIASFDMEPSFVGETTCDEACDDKLCCGSAKCWGRRISICLAEGEHPAPCWSCLCEMSWGCLSHHHDACKKSCDTCNQNTWSGTHEHCTYHL